MVSRLKFLNGATTRALVGTGSLSGVTTVPSIHIMLICVGLPILLMIIRKPRKGEEASMQSFLWDDFCENQGVTECEEIVDLCASGVLKQLMAHNLTREVSYDCIHYPDGTADEHGPFTDYSTYHVDAYPAQSELITFRNGMEISHDGPDACNNQLIHRGAPPSGAGGPSVFLYYNRYPEF